MLLNCCQYILIASLRQGVYARAPFKARAYLINSACSKPAPPPCRAFRPSARLSRLAEREAVEALIYLQTSRTCSCLPLAPLSFDSAFSASPR